MAITLSLFLLASWWLVITSRPRRRWQRWRKAALTGKTWTHSWPNWLQISAQWAKTVPDTLKKAPVLDAGMIATEVAARLRSGTPVPLAWQQTLLRHPSFAAVKTAGKPQLVFTTDGIPVALQQWAAGQKGASRQAVPGLLAACRFTHELGAPLAQILDQVATGIAEAARAAQAREIALAGPKASARLLRLLPVGGLGLGLALGADPFSVLTDGSWGSFCAAIGATLTAVGWIWSHRLVARAATAGGKQQKRVRS